MKRAWCRVSSLQTEVLIFDLKTCKSLPQKVLSFDCCWVRGGLGAQLFRYWNRFEFNISRVMVLDTSLVFNERKIIALALDNHEIWTLFKSPMSVFKCCPFIDVTENFLVKGVFLYFEEELTCVNYNNVQFDKRKKVPSFCLRCVSWNFSWCMLT